MSESWGSQIKHNYPHLYAHPELTLELSTFDLRSGLINAPFSYKQCQCSSSNNQNGNDNNNNNNKRTPNKWRRLPMCSTSSSSSVVIREEEADDVDDDRG